MLTSVGEASTSDNEKNLDSVIRNEVMLHSSTVTASTAELRTSVTVNCKNSRNIVKFSSIEIREYGYTLGNHPDCSAGPPLTLEWDFNPVGRFKLDEYEACRPDRRSMCQMLLTYSQRIRILREGTQPVLDSAIKATVKEMDRIKNHRQRTRLFLPYQKLEEVVQSTGRKVKRATNHNGSNQIRRSQSLTCNLSNQMVDI